MGLKQVMTPHKEFMAENIPIFWEFMKKDFSPEDMVEYGSPRGIYVYKRQFSQEGKENEVLACKMEFIEFKEEEINNKRKD